MKYLILLIIILMSGCKLDSDKKVDRDKFSFIVGDDTYLFFKNIRQSYYDLEESDVAKFNIYRLKKRNQSSDNALLNLAIVVSYLKSEAYILLEPNELMGDIPYTIISVNDSTKQQHEIILETQNRESMLHFAADIYDDLLHGHSFFLKNDSLRFLENAKEREAFRITMSDYYRLTRVY